MAKKKVVGGAAADVKAASTEDAASPSSSPRAGRAGSHQTSSDTPRSWANPGPSAAPPLEADEQTLMATVRAKIQAERSRSTAFAKRSLFQLGTLSGAVMFDKWEAAGIAAVYVFGTFLLCYGVYRQIMHVLRMD